MLLRMVIEVAAPTMVHPGEQRNVIHSLAPLGVPPSAGVTRRPVLLGGAQTERLLKQLKAVCAQRVERVVLPRAKQNISNPAHSGWAERFVPQHLPDRELQWAKWGGPVTSYGARACLQAAAKAKRKANREGLSVQSLGSSSPPAQRRRTNKMGSNLPTKQSPEKVRGKGQSPERQGPIYRRSGSPRCSGGRVTKGKSTTKVNKVKSVSERIISPGGVKGENSSSRVEKAGGAVKRGFSEIGEGRGNPPVGFGSPGGSRSQKKARRGRGNPEARVE
jgi:hypothetical protein